MHYSFSQTIVKKRKANSLITAMMILVGIPVYTFALIKLKGTDIDLKILVPILVGASIFIQLELWIVSKIMYKKIAQNALEFTESGFKRLGGKVKDEVAFNSIKAITAKVNKDKPENMIIQVKTNRGKVLLNGYDNMPSILDHFVALNLPVEQKSQPIDWAHPLTTLVVFLLITPLMLVLTTAPNLGDYTSLFVTTGMGLYFLIGRPMTKYSGKRFAKFELIIGGLMLVAGLLSFVAQMFSL